MTEMPICEVCNINRSFAVACSPLGPISHAYCRTCASEGAEPEWMISATIEMCGGRDKVKPEILKIPVFRGGRYEPFDAEQDQS